MSDIITFIQTAFDSPVNSIVIILLFIAAIRGLYEIVKWIKKELDTWYTSRLKEENRVDNFEGRLESLEKENQRQFEKLENIDATLQDITATLEIMAEQERANTVAICRSTLLKMYSDLEGKPSVTSAEYETFMDLADRYLKNNGNSVFKDKIIPYVKDLQIKD